MNGKDYEKFIRILNKDNIHKDAIYDFTTRGKKNSLTVSLLKISNIFFVVFVQKKKKVKTKTTKLKTKKVRNNIRTRTSRLIFYLHCLAIMMCQGKLFKWNIANEWKIRPQFQVRWTIYLQYVDRIVSVQCKSRRRHYRWVPHGFKL